MRVVERILSVYSLELPENWSWFTAHCAFGEGVTSYFTEYGMSEDSSSIKTDFNNTTDKEPLFTELRNTIAPPPMEQPTHIELTIHHNGKVRNSIGLRRG